MHASEFCILPYCLIPLSSDEALWEWDIVTDTFFLSHGAFESLKLKERPAKMSDFYNLLPPDAAVELAQMRDTVISGKNGSLLECGYLCNGLWVDEHLLVLSRNSEGRATRIMGSIIVTPILQHQMGFKSGQSLLQEAGLWIYDVRSGKIWRDKACGELLGRGDNLKYPIDRSESMMEVHPSERDALKRHYELFCKGNFLGDSITDIIRVKLGNGEYAPILTRAVALERDENGRAVLIAGLMAQNEPQIAAMDMLNKDDRLFHALNSMGSGQWNWDTKIDAMYFCPRYLSMLGYLPEDGSVFAKNWRKHIHPDDLDKVNKVQQSTIASPDNGDTYECTYRMKRADGGWAWIFDRGYVTWRDADGKAGHMIGSITNITTAQAERDKLEDLVRHDTLTGLRSRAFCNLEMEHIEQNSIRPVSVISVDITGLKMVNDNLGHAKGDELLTKAATLLRGSLRRTDCVARVGGDEFLVLLPTCDKDKATKILNKIEASFKAYNEKHGTIPVYAAFGLASADSAKDTLEDAISNADEAMYHNKKLQRKEAHAAIKGWIKDCTGNDVGHDDRIDD